MNLPLTNDCLLRMNAGRHARRPRLFTSFFFPSFCACLFPVKHFSYCYFYDLVKSRLPLSLTFSFRRLTIVLMCCHGHNGSCRATLHLLYPLTTDNSRTYGRGIIAQSSSSPRLITLFCKTLMHTFNILIRW